MEKETFPRDIAIFNRNIKSIETLCLKNELTININKMKLQYFPHNRNADCMFFLNDVCHIYGQQLFVFSQRGFALGPQGFTLVLHWGCKPTQWPNANGFGFWWNIGNSLFNFLTPSLAEHTK